MGVLQAVQLIVDEQLAHPILVGRPSIIAERMQHLGLRYELDKDVSVVNPGHDPRFKSYWSEYHSLMERQGITHELAKFFVRTQPTIIGALMIRLGDADAMICGTVGRYNKHYQNVGNNSW